MIIAIVVANCIACESLWKNMFESRKKPELLSHRHRHHAVIPAGYHLAKWLVLSYKQSANNVRENRIFNYHLSKIQIRCEHTIGYLKGQFRSMKELRVRIRGEDDLTFATAWINTCIVLHAI